jgi:hypothetical protein
MLQSLYRPNSIKYIIFEFNFDLELIKKGLVEVKKNNKKEQKTMFGIGVYDDNKEVFTWNEITRKSTESLIPKNDPRNTFLHGFGDTFKKLCSKSEIKMEKKFRNVIPYLIVILLYPYNLYKATSEEKPEKTSYFGIELNLTKA